MNFVFFIQLWLHWGFASRGRGWKAPTDEFLPEGTKKVDDKAVQSPFKNDKIVSIRAKPNALPQCVLRFCYDPCHR